ncbi:MAG: Gfo/Idh/MocA family oxidoreductase [Bryobacterales bacterium]|nr:Gfo/Idh/MocA family oxidoreductase [Bryobacterales bacterium]
MRWWAAALSGAIICAWCAIRSGRNWWRPVDADAAKAEAGAAEFGGAVLTDIAGLRGKADAAIVAVPTTLHAEVGCALMEAGLDVLIEKPIASTVAEAERLVATAAAHGRILQVGQLERFNPAVMALAKAVRVPLFFEVHRLSVFAPRSLDVDVVLDLMIHDLDIVLSLVGEEPNEVRAAGIRILSEKVDIANVRLAFPGGCVANLTASRVSTEKVRKLRLFQPHEYISIDYARQDGMVIGVDGRKQVSFGPLAAVKRSRWRRSWTSSWMRWRRAQRRVWTGGGNAGAGGGV